jgi:hypothetical protein
MYSLHHCVTEKNLSGIYIQQSRGHDISLEKETIWNDSSEDITIAT